MAKSMKTPGVYINELNAFGDAVVPVPTAVPVFIGYTGQTEYNGKSLVNRAVKITSFAEFQTIFGNTPPLVQFSMEKLETPAFAMDDATNKTVAQNDYNDLMAKIKNVDFKHNNFALTLVPTSVNYRLYSSVKFFYENGGGYCYIFSVGGYDNKPMEIKLFEDALDILKKEPEPTIVVIPDAIEIADSTVTDKSDLSKIYADCYSLQSQMINHCGAMENRVAILDIPRGYIEMQGGETSIDFFRDKVEPTQQKYNSYATAYYPWLHTTVLQISDVSYQNIQKESQDVIKELINIDDPKGVMTAYIDNLFTVDSKSPTQDEAHSALMNLSPAYKLVMEGILKHLNLMAPSGAMAGIYTMVDNNEGVWVAPANVGIQSVITPAIQITSDMQEDINVPIDGKSICAIRIFVGRGVLVWGARTLDGNSNDFRYINVRRTLIYIEQSVKAACKAYVYAPNDSSTWTNVSSMVSNFLTGLWKQGGIIGPKPVDAFAVSVGLGSTMTHDDIMNGIMRVSVKVAVSHPADFFDITFQQEMQKG